MNTVEYLIKQLGELGITDYFGVPGDYNFNIVYAVQENSDTNWIGCTNELNAGYAADGYAREKGFGAVVTTYGVGELSAINAIAGSYAENVPVIHIVGTPSTKVLNAKTVVHHGFAEPKYDAYMEAYRNVTQAVAFLNRDNAKIEIDRVLKAFIKERKPVYIAIPEDIAVLDISERKVDYDWQSDTETLKTVVEKISSKIEKAENPLILADTLVKRFNARVEVRELVEKSGIPAVNFVMGTDILDYSIPNYLGTYLAEYGNSMAKKALETTDCLIAVGVIYSDVNSFGFKLPYKINSQIAIYGTYTYVDGIKYENVKMSDVLSGITKNVEHKNYNVKREDWQYSEVKPEGRLTNEYIYPRMQEFFSGNDIIIADTGLVSHGIFGAKLPDGAKLHTQSLWCSIGWAVPCALGICTARPNSRVVVITGEGAHQQTAMEFGSLLRYGHKPVIVVINNGGYAIERLISDKPDNDMNDIVQINYAKFARAFDGDVWSTKVETADDFDKALRVTGIMNKLCYIEAITEKTDYPSISVQLLKNNEVEKSDDKKGRKTKKKAELSKNEDYSTTVHESLQFD